MVRKILIGILVVVMVLVIIVATRSSVFHVERTTSIGAAPEAVFAHIRDFHAWTTWSPWEGLDPQMERTYSGPPADVGAQYAWRSANDKVGQGRMTIERADAPSLLVVKLEFIKPFAATNTVTFEVAPDAGGSSVTWAMDGKNGFLGKLFHMVMDMDKMVGGDFARGLANLKRVAESPSPPAAVRGESAAKR